MFLTRSSDRCISCEARVESPRFVGQFGVIVGALCVTCAAVTLNIGTLLACTEEPCMAFATGASEMDDGENWEGWCDKHLALGMLSEVVGAH